MTDSSGTAPVRVGVVGTGWGLVHAQTAASLSPLFEIVALCSRDDSRRKAAAETLGLGSAAAEKDWNSLLRRSDVDLVVVAPPDDLHFQVTMAALRQGKHVVCEKPLATSASEGREMLREAQGRGLSHFTSFPWRYVPACATLKRLLDQGELGIPRYLDLQFRIGPPRPGREWQLTRKGGAFANSMVHLVDLVRYLTGDYLSGTVERGQGKDAPETWRLWSHGGAAVEGSMSQASPAHSWMHLEAVNAVLQARLQASQDWQLRSAYPLRVELHGTSATAIARVNPLEPSSQDVRLLRQISGSAEPVDELVSGADRWDDVDTARGAAAVLRPAMRHLYSAYVYPAVRGAGESRTAPSFFDGYAAQLIIDAGIQACATADWQTVKIAG